MCFFTLYQWFPNFFPNIIVKFSGGMDPAVLKELPPELLAEIESTMPLCERVKMNKRKRSTVNERPKYAEVSSDEDYDATGECESIHSILTYTKLFFAGSFTRCENLFIFLNLASFFRV